MSGIFSYIFSVIIASMLISFAISFPVISLLYRFKITRRLDYDFTSVLEKVNLKAGVPIMGGLIIVLTVLFVNLLFNPKKGDIILGVLLFAFFLSALLGAFDDVLNIYGRERVRLRSIGRTLKLIKGHKLFWKRIILALGLPWLAYKRFFYMLGSNPGKGIQAHEKIIVQSFVGIVLGYIVYFRGNWEIPGLVNIPVLGIGLDIGLLMVPFVWITVVLMANAVNLSDGMDGLAATQLLLSFGGFLLIAISKNEIWLAFLIASTIGSLVSYLYFNVPPARFQMGDVGSLALGTLLAGVAFMLQEPLLLLIISFTFVITLLSTVIQGIGRRVLGRRIFKMAPIHYHLQINNNWSEEKVVMRLTLLGLFCALVGLWIYL